MEQRSSPVQSVDRALRILECLAERGGGLRLGEVARLAGLPLTTVHRLLTALQQREFVQFAAASAEWQVGRMAFRVGAGFLHRAAIVAPATPLMRRLRDETHETVNLAELADGDVTIIAQAESREIIRVINVVGGRVPLSTSGLGKAMLATWSDAAFDDHVARHGLPAATVRSLTDPGALRRDLSRARARGYALDREEHCAGLICLAAPVFGADGEARAAVSVSGLAGRMSPDRIARIAPMLVSCARALTLAQDGLTPAGWAEKCPTSSREPTGGVIEA